MASSVEFAAINDPVDIGPLEEACARMARACSIDMAVDEAHPSRPGDEHLQPAASIVRPPGKRVPHGAVRAAPSEHRPIRVVSITTASARATLAITRSMADVEQGISPAWLLQRTCAKPRRSRPPARLPDWTQSRQLAPRPAFDLTYSNGPGGGHHTAVRRRRLERSRARTSKNSGKSHGFSVKSVGGYRRCPLCIGRLAGSCA